MDILGIEGGCDESTNSIYQVCIASNGHIAFCILSLLIFLKIRLQVMYSRFHFLFQEPYPRLVLAARNRNSSCGRLFDNTHDYEEHGNLLPQRYAFNKISTIY